MEMIVTGILPLKNHHRNNAVDILIRRYYAIKREIDIMRTALLTARRDSDTIDLFNKYQDKLYPDSNRQLEKIMELLNKVKK